MATASSSTVLSSTAQGRVAILLALTDVAARLTLKAVLEKSGYVVDSAASSAEAMDKVEKGQYALILCDLQGESAAASRNVLKLAQTQEYRPATAYLTTSREQSGSPRESEELLIAPVDVPALLTKIADLIASRAAGRARRAVRRTGS